MNGILQDLIAPYQSWRSRKKKEEELRFVNPLNMNDVLAEQKPSIVERDLDKILSENIDTGLYSSLTIEFPLDYLDLVKSYLKGQGLEYIELSDTQIKIKG